MKITFVYPNFGGALQAALERTFTAVLGETAFAHIGESNILSEVIEQGGLGKKQLCRLMSIYDAAAKGEPDVIVTICSSIGRSAELAAQICDTVPILRIDAPMAEYCVARYTRIGMMATIGTTLEPSEELILRAARERCRKIRLQSIVPAGAWEAMMAGDGKTYAGILNEAARGLAQSCDVILLAQASMAANAEEISAACGKPVLSSPGICAEYIRDHITPATKRSERNEAFGK